MGFADRFNLVSYKIQELLLVLFAFVFVLGYKYGHFVLIFVVANWLSRAFTRGNNFSKVLTLEFLTQSTVFFIACIGLLSTFDLARGLRVIEKLLPILILPLVLITSPTLTLKYRNRVLVSYLAACFLAAMLSLAIKLWNDIKSDGSISDSFIQYSGHSLAEPLNVHPTYLALYLVLGIAISFHLIDFRTRRNWYNLALFIFAIISSVFVILLNARTEIIILILYFAGLIVYYILTKGNKYLKIVITLGALVPLIIILLSPPLKESLNKRFGEIKDISNSNLIGTNYENGVNQRAFLWQQGAILIAKNPIVGIGTGDFDIAFKNHLYHYLNTHPDLTESKITAVRSFISNELNVHNQYLQVLIQYGLIGFICFISMLLIAFYWSWANKNYVYTIFLIFISIAMISENILDRASGIYLFSFFNALLGLSINTYSNNKTHASA